MIDYLTDLPKRMRQLPLDEAGRPVPKFVEWVEGKPDFRLMSMPALGAAVRRKLCWVCGEPLGRLAAFVSGPMCVVNLISAEPPSHYECALYSATHCPFLNNPDKGRREAHMAEGSYEVAAMIKRNPGVTALIVTGHWEWMFDPLGSKGVLFKIGSKLPGVAEMRRAAPQRLKPTVVVERVEWYSRGREATADEVAASIESGLPILREACKENAYAHDMLDHDIERAQQWLP